MAIDIGELRGTLSLQDSFSEGIEKAEKQLGFFSQKISAFGAVTGVFGIASAAIVGVGAAIVEMGRRGDEVDDVGEAFAGLSKAAGSSADVMLGALRSGTVGAISDFDLMKIGTKTLGGGMIKTAEDMGTLAKGARMLAKDTGMEGGTAAAFEMLSKAMATGRVGMLAAKGLGIDVSSSMKAMADAHGVATEKLTKHEKAAAGANAILAELNRRYKDPAPADFGEMIDKGKAFVVNLTDKLSVAIAQSPVIMAGFKAVGDAIGGAFGGNQQDLVKTIMGYVNNFAIALVQAAAVGATTGQALVQVFYGIKTVIAAVMTTMAGFALQTIGVVDGIAQLGSHIPGVGEKLKGFADWTKDARQSVAGLTIGLVEETKAAAEGAKGHSWLGEGLGKVATAAFGVADKMKAAKGAIVEAEKPVRDFGKASDEVGKKVQIDYAGIASAFGKLQDDLELAGETGYKKMTIQAQKKADAEIRSIDKLKGITKQQQSDLYDLVAQRYAKEVDLAKSGGEAVAKKVAQLEAQAAQVYMGATERKIALIQQKRAEDLEDLKKNVAAETDQYKKLDAAINKSADAQIKVTKDQYSTETKILDTYGSDVRKTLQKNVDAAQAAYDAITKSAQYSAAAREEAEKALSIAQKSLAKNHAMTNMEMYETISGAASSTLGAIFGKSKTAAIAGSIIDTISAVVKTLAAYPFPWSLIPAAAVAAVGYMNVAKIQNTSAGFAQGTPDATFMQFGPATASVLHGEEAVVTRAQGQSLAEMLKGSIEGADGKRQARSTTVNVNIPVNENPMQTYESREEHREFTLRSVKQDLARNLPRMIALGQA